MFICAVFWCGLWLWPCLSGCPVLAESRYPRTCTHTYWHICIYIYIYINLTRILPKAWERSWHRVLEEIINWSVLSWCRMREEPEMNTRHQLYSEMSCLIEDWTPTSDWKLHTFQAPTELWRKGEIPPTKHSLSFAPIEPGGRFV